MTDVLAQYYPLWKANCEESIRWLSSEEELNKFYSQPGMLTKKPTPEEIAIKIAEYKKKIELYEFLIKKNEGEQS
jgi:hypothetical protein